VTEPHFDCRVPHAAAGAHEVFILFDFDEANF
jgi:hypothetical protein